MYQTLNIEIVGVAPLIMHNGQTADPMNKYARLKSEITGKRQKTEADHLEIARIEFLAALYMHQGEPVLQARMIEAMIGEGAKKIKLGKLVSAGVIVEKHAVLAYDGPREATALLENDRFRLAVPVRIGQKKVVTTRPIFNEWNAELEVKYLPDVMNERNLRSAIRNAGAFCGVGDWRPRHGRFVLREDLPQALAAE